MPRVNQSAVPTLVPPSDTQASNLVRGAKTMRAKDAEAYGRGKPSKASLAKQLLKGVKLGVTGGVQAAAYDRMARMGVGGMFQDKVQDKAIKTSRKAADGLELMRSALKGKAPDAGVQASVAKRDAKNAEKKAQKEAIANARIDRFSY